MLHHSCQSVNIGYISNSPEPIAQVSYYYRNFSGVRPSVYYFI